MEATMIDRKIVEEKQFVFIIGSPRSGTTWLLTMLLEHQDICGLDQVEQTLFSRYIFPITQAWDLETNNIKSGKWVQGLPYLWTEQEFFDFITYFINKVYAKVAVGKKEAKYIIDKHPNYTNYIKTITRFVPHSKFIHLIRDGRDVVVSMTSARKRVGFGAENISGAAYEWKQHVLNAIESASELSGNYIEVRYEKLVKDGENELKRIFEFLGVTFNEKQIREIIKNNIFEKKKVSSPNEEINDIRFKKDLIWKSKLSLRERYKFNLIAGKLLIDLQYADKNWWAYNNLHKILMIGYFPFVKIEGKMKRLFKCLFN